MQKNKKRFSKRNFFLNGIVAIVSSTFITLFLVLLFFVKNHNAFKAIGIPFINRSDLLRIYKKIYTPEEYKARYEVTGRQMLNCFMELAAAAIFKGNVDGVDVSPFYKFGQPILEPYRQKLEDSIKAVLKILEVNNVKLVVKNAELIPKDGRLIVISNHIGVNDGVSAIHINSARGADNLFILGTQYSPKYFRAMPHVVLGVSLFGDYMVPGAEEEILQKILENRALLIFPSGLIGSRKFKDGYLRFAMKTGAAIQPVRIKMDMPWWFNFLRERAPGLAQTLVMVFAWRIYKNKTLEVIFGKPIPFSELEKMVEGQTYIDKRGKTRYKQELLDAHSRLVESISA